MRWLLLLLIVGCAVDEPIDIPPVIEKVEVVPMKISSPVFENNENIPDKYTCKGEDINPPLTIENIPENTKSLVLIIDDPDAPIGIWVHWIVYNMPANTARIAENSAPGIQGRNSWGRNEYGGPCPPSGTHRYFFKLYALDTELDLGEEATKQVVEGAMTGHILEKTELIGLFSK